MTVPFFFFFFLVTTFISAAAFAQLPAGRARFPASVVAALGGVVPTQPMPSRTQAAAPLRAGLPFSFCFSIRRGSYYFGVGD